MIIVPVIRRGSLIVPILTRRVVVRGLILRGCDCYRDCQYIMYLEDDPQMEGRGEVQMARKECSLVDFDKVRKIAR